MSLIDILFFKDWFRHTLSLSFSELFRCYLIVKNKFKHVEKESARLIIYFKGKIMNKLTNRLFFIPIDADRGQKSDRFNLLIYPHFSIFRTWFTKTNNRIG